MLPGFEDHTIKKIECFVIDFTGLGRGKVFYADSFRIDQQIHLPIATLCQTIDGDFADIYDDQGNIYNATDADMNLHCDLETACILPWRKEKTLSVICDGYREDNTPVPFSPRQVLKNTQSLYQNKSWQPIVAVELEFFVSALTNTTNESTATSSDHRQNQPYGLEYSHRIDNFFDDVYTACQQQGILINSVLKEVTNNQYEINLPHDDPLVVADSVCRVKRTLREIAHQHQLKVSFIAKLKDDEPGNSMHIHQSLIDCNTKTNLFSTPTGQHSQLFLSFIGGIQKHIADSSCLLLPYVNSYKRLVPYLTAPTNIEWSTDNRTVGLRVPAFEQGKHDPSRRLENRISGADCNPYLAIALSLTCGYDGMLNKIDPKPEFSASAYDLSSPFPNSLAMALYRLHQSEFCKRYFGDEFQRVFLAIKEAELASYQQQITAWELTYLDGVV